MRYSQIPLVCPICGKTRMIKKSHQHKHSTCGSKSCFSEYRMRCFCDELEQKIQEPIHSALLRLYVLEQRPFRYICSLWQINNRTIKKLLNRFSIPIRYGSEAVKTQWIGNDKRKKWAAQNIGSIASQQFGDKNHNYQGGPIGGTHEMLGWNKYADEIRQRDKNRCTCCGFQNDKHIKKYGLSLCVHHIVPYKLSLDNSSQNLRTLCVPCHMQKEYEFKWLL